MGASEVLGGCALSVTIVIILIYSSDSGHGHFGSSSVAPGCMK